MTEKYAILDNANGHLVNTVLWDGDTAKWQAPAGTTAVRLADLDLATLPPAPAPQAEPVVAEEFLEANGYGPLRLVALLDLEAKLAAAQKSSAAMSAARQWIDGILAAYATDPSPRSDWPSPPVAFEDAVSGAVQALSS